MLTLAAIIIALLLFVYIFYDGGNMNKYNTLSESEVADIGKAYKTMLKEKHKELKKEIAMDMIDEMKRYYKGKK